MVFIISCNVLYKPTVAYGEQINDILTKKLPNGLPDADKLFTLGTIPGTFNNSSFGATGTSVVPIILTTEQAGVYGSVWSKASAGNYFDITKAQTMSMWLYFGNRFENAGNGMAFVLQNDKHKTEAFSLNSNGKGEGGETLGVWGTTPGVDGISAIAKRAIQNSWALEFDSHKDTPVNNQWAANANFDNGLTFPSNGLSDHIASAYPGQPATYTPFNGSFMSLMMNHSGVVMLGDEFTGNDRYLSNGKWRHLSIHWDPIAKQITYTFNDKAFDEPGLPDGAPTGQAITRTVPVDPTVFLATQDSKILWGFTGTTWNKVENNLVIFESMPAFVAGDVTAQIKDVVQNRVLNEDDTVHVGDTLAVNYQLHYNSGSEDWGSILATLRLPQQVSYTSGKVTYQNGQQDSIDLQNLTENEIKVALKQNLNLNNNTATLELVGTVESVTTDTEVAATTSHFAGRRLITDATTPAFKIERPELGIMEQTPNPMALKIGEDGFISGKIQYRDNHEVVNQQQTLYTKLNDGALVSRNVQETSQIAGTFNINIAHQALHVGTNVLEVYLKDQTGLKSNVITYLINVIGVLELEPMADLYFQQGFSSQAHQIIQRQDNWMIKVIDSRAPGLNWHIQAQATKLLQDQTVLNGELIYVADSGQITPLSDTPISVGHGVKSGLGVQTTDLTTQWQPTTGILLRTSDYNEPGTYQGTITWTAVNSL